MQACLRGVPSIDRYSIAVAAAPVTHACILEQLNNKEGRKEGKGKETSASAVRNSVYITNDMRVRRPNSGDDDDDDDDDLTRARERANPITPSFTFSVGRCVCVVTDDLRVNSVAIIHQVSPAVGRAGGRDSGAG